MNFEFRALNKTEFHSLPYRFHCCWRPTFAVNCETLPQ